MQMWSRSWHSGGFHDPWIISLVLIGFARQREEFAHSGWIWGWWFRTRPSALWAIAFRDCSAGFFRFPMRISGFFFRRNPYVILFPPIGDSCVYQTRIVRRLSAFFWGTTNCVILLHYTRLEVNCRSFALLFLWRLWAKNLHDHRGQTLWV